jgi:hypothetical protein
MLHDSNVLPAFQVLVEIIQGGNRFSLVEPQMRLHSRLPAAGNTWGSEIDGHPFGWIASWPAAGRYQLNLILMVF